VKLGTRGSALALVQAHAVADALGGDAEIVEITTSGDRGIAGDKARWIDTIEDALESGAIDLAVHSAKDVPAASLLRPGMALAAVLAREDARDALVGAASLEALPAGARIGTASLRRRAQLLSVRDDLDVIDLRGNVDTRLRRLADGDFDAIVLAAAGLLRLERADAGDPVGTDVLTPAPGQGCLALEGRAGDKRVRDLAGAITDRAALTAYTAERALVDTLEATCDTPVGAYAALVEDGAVLRVSAFAGMPDGSTWVRDTLDGDAHDPTALGRLVADRMLAAGAGEVLAAAAAA
jgi:hydroxymethylbilane synthase